MSAAPAAAEAAPIGPDVFGQSWQGRRVTVVGLGRSGLGAAALLRRAGARVRVTEARHGAALQQAQEAARSIGVEAVEVGGHTTRFLDNSELLVVSPGVPESASPIQWALHHRRPILSEIELAFRFCPSPVVAVTGTNGKSTAVTLLAELVQAGGRSAVACGNLGVPFSSVIHRLTPHSIAVVEVSSFQLLWCDTFRPKVGVLLNISANHLDRHQDPQAYRSAKARLFQRQTPEDWAVLNGGDPQVAALAPQVHARCVWFGENRANPSAFRLAPETQRALTPGAQAILQVGRILGIADPLSWQVIRLFRGLEHRMERVATIRGVQFVNDSKSTTPDSLLFALRQLRGDVVVILGGRDKGLDFTPLVAPLHQERVKGIVLMGESRARLRALLNGSATPSTLRQRTLADRSGCGERATASRTTAQESGSLEEAVRAAAGLASPGATVLLSPACASFDMFRDFEDRGRAFKAIVQNMANSECRIGIRNSAFGIRYDA